jgi:hypothetical protein
MKYFIILLILIKQLFTHKIINKKDIVWVKVVANVNQYRYELLKIFPPTTLENVVVYIKVNLTSKKINLFLFGLNDQEAELFGLGSNDSIGIIRDQIVHSFELDMIHTNYKLTMFYRLQGVGVFYHLDAIRELRMARAGDEGFNRQQILRDFEENIEINENFEERSPHGDLEWKIKSKIIATRNEKISEIYNLLQKKPNVKALREMLVLLRLSNRDSVAKFTKNFSIRLNRILQEMGTKDFNVELISPMSEPLYSIFTIFNNALRTWDAEKIQSNLSYYNQRIDSLINTFINLLAEIFMSELGSISHFEDDGVMILFRDYLYFKYLNFGQVTGFQKQFLMFFENDIIFRQFDINIYYEKDLAIHCWLKIAFYKEIKKTYELYNNDFNTWVAGIPQNEEARENKFSFYKAKYENAWNDELASEFMLPKLKLSDITDRIDFFIADAPLGPLTSNIDYKPWKKVFGFKGCLYETAEQ